MPLPPAQPVGAPDRNQSDLPFPAIATATANGTSEDLVNDSSGFVTAVRLVPQGAAAANGTNYRTYTLVDPTTKTATDGAIAPASAVQGDWVNGGTTATAGQVWYYNNQPYLCISSIANGTVNLSADTGHWLPLAGLGLNVLNSVQYAFTLNDVGKVLSDAGNSHVPAGTTIVGVVQLPNASAALLSNLGSATYGDTVTIGSSRVLATLSTATTSLAAGVEVDMVLSTTDTAVYVSDVLQLVSTASGSGVADPGGTAQIEVTGFAAPRQ